jgi:peptide/nickel transport system ATP-binding protein
MQASTKSEVEKTAGNTRFHERGADGTVVELPLQVNEALENNIISSREIESRFERLVSNEPVLSVRNLKTWFSAEKNFFGGSALVTKAVDDVTFDVYPGETLGLVGESGCGKTTLGRSILQLVPPTDGHVIFEKQELTSLPREEMQKVRRNISILFQDPYSSLNPRLTAGYAIMEPMRVHGIYANDEERREVVSELLHKVNMPADSISRFPHEFSGGQRQRICIARLLALSPRFIICDEAVSALDVSVSGTGIEFIDCIKG